MALDLIHSDPPAVPRPWLAGGLHYVGSTAVPGLVAKPILDMIAGVRDLTDASAAIGALAALSYAHAEHRPRALLLQASRGRAAAPFLSPASDRAGQRPVAGTPGLP